MMMLAALVVKRSWDRDDATTPTPLMDLAGALARVRGRWRRVDGPESGQPRPYDRGGVAGWRRPSSGTGSLTAPSGAPLQSMAAWLCGGGGRRAPTPPPAPDHRRVARFVEERYPACGDAIVTAVDVADGGSTGSRVRAARRGAAAAAVLPTLDLDAVVDRRQTRFAAWRAAGAAMAGVLAAISRRRPARVGEWPTFAFPAPSS